jgi:phosphatidylinositol glycan class B
MANDSHRLKSLSLKRPLLFAFLLIALFARVGLAIRVPALTHPDEIFQTQEPAHRLAYGYGVISWEWRRGVRSWVFPAFLAFVMRATDWMGVGSTGYLRGIVVALSLISLTTVWFGFAWAKRASGMNAAVIASAACAMWFELVYFAPRALTEVVATHLLLPGLYLGVYGEGLREKPRLFFAGVFCGLALSLRIQLAPAVAFAGVYFCRPNWRNRIPAVAAGIVLPIIAFGFVDAVTWGHFFQSFLLYFWVNVVEQRSVQYGTEPWYYYVVKLLRHLGPVALLALIGLRRSAFLGWLVLIILVCHSVLPHKEFRFLHPLLPIVITLGALGVTELAAALNAHCRSPLSSRTIIAIGLALFALTSGLLALRFDWSSDSGSLIALDQLSSDPTVCGVGLYGVEWQVSGGYTLLHQHIPILLFPEDSISTQEAESVNAMVTDGIVVQPQPGFELADCWAGVCLYRRSGQCISPPQECEINTALRLSEE